MSTAIKRITFRHMEHSAAMEQHANQQLAKIEEFLSNEPTPIYIDLIFEPSHVHEHHKVELRVKTPHYELYSTYEKQGMNFYEVLDHVIDVMYRELHEQKKRLKKDGPKTIGRHEEFKKQR